MSKKTNPLFMVNHKKNIVEEASNAWQQLLVFWQLFINTLKNGAPASFVFSLLEQLKKRLEQYLPQIQLLISSLTKKLHFS